MYKRIDGDILQFDLYPRQRVVSYGVGKWKDDINLICLLPHRGTTIQQQWFVMAIWEDGEEEEEHEHHVLVAGD